MAVADVMKKIKQEKIKFVDLRFTDTKGKEQHVSVPTFAFNKSKFTILIFFTPDVHNITNSLSLTCFKIKIIIATRQARGINFGANPKRFKIEYKKYTDTG